jgi:hypothetical protein
MVSEPERFNQVVLDWLGGVVDTAPQEGEEQTADQVVIDENVAT